MRDAVKEALEKAAEALIKRVEEWHGVGPARSEAADFASHAIAAFLRALTKEAFIDIPGVTPSAAMQVRRRLLNAVARAGGGA